MVVGVTGAPPGGCKQTCKTTDLKSKLWTFPGYVTRTTAQNPQLKAGDEKHILGPSQHQMVHNSELAPSTTLRWMDEETGGCGGWRKVQRWVKETAIEEAQEEKFQINRQGGIISV